MQLYYNSFQYVLWLRGLLGIDSFRPLKLPLKYFSKWLHKTLAKVMLAWGMDTKNCQHLTSQKCIWFDQNAPPPLPAPRRQKSSYEKLWPSLQPATPVACAYALISSRLWRLRSLASRLWRGALLRIMRHLLSYTGCMYSYCGFFCVPVFDRLHLYTR